MASVLVVDDDASFLASLVDALASEDYAVTTAQNGLEALGLLDQKPFDLILSDVKMPRMDGIRLITELINRGTFIPCIVMTAYGTSDMEDRVAQLGGIEVVHKPVDLPSLKARIRDALSARHEASLVRGIGLPSFLQVLAVERMTCTVRVKSDTTSGLLFFKEGSLLDATAGDKRGVEAALELLAADRVEIVTRNGCRRRGRVVEESLDALLLEAMRRRDEGTRPAWSDTKDSQQNRQKEKIMGLEQHLSDFKDVKGYMAAGILDFTGEILASHSASAKVDLAATGAVFNDIFRAAHEASGKIGLDACRNLVIGTPKGVIVMECSGMEVTPHVHLIVILEEGGNQALAKMTISKVLPKIVGDLT